MIIRLPMLGLWKSYKLTDDQLLDIVFVILQSTIAGTLKLDVILGYKDNSHSKVFSLVRMMSYCIH